MWSAHVALMEAGVGEASASVETMTGMPIQPNKFPDLLGMILTCTTNGKDFTMLRFNFKKKKDKRNWRKSRCVHLNEVVFGNMSRIAKRRNSGGTTLMKTIATSSAVKALEEQPTAWLAVCQWEKSLTDLHDNKREVRKSIRQCLNNLIPINLQNCAICW